MSSNSSDDFVVLDPVLTELEELSEFFREKKPIFENMFNTYGIEIFKDSRFLNIISLQDSQSLERAVKELALKFDADSASESVSPTVLALLNQNRVLENEQKSLKAELDQMKSALYECTQQLEVFKSSQSPAKAPFVTHEFGDETSCESVWSSSSDVGMVTSVSTIPLESEHQSPIDLFGDDEDPVPESTRDRTISASSMCASSFAGLDCSMLQSTPTDYSKEQLEQLSEKLKNLEAKLQDHDRLLSGQRVEQNTPTSSRSVSVGSCDPERCDGATTPTPPNAPPKVMSIKIESLPRICPPSYERMSASVVPLTPTDGIRVYPTLEPESDRPLNANEEVLKCPICKAEFSSKLLMDQHYDYCGV